MSTKKQAWTTVMSVEYNARNYFLFSTEITKLISNLAKTSTSRKYQNLFRVEEVAI